MKQNLDNFKQIDLTEKNTQDIFDDVDIKSTTQRINIAKIIFRKHQHLSAEDIIAELNDSENEISRATVYNTLNLFADKGLVRRVVIDSSKVYYDSKTTPHSHYYNIDTGEIQDFEINDVKINPTPELPKNTLQEGIDVVVRIKNLK